MKKIWKRLSSFLLGMVIMIGSASATAFAADSSVTYEGGAEKFVFLPGSEYTDSDLFDNFKGVMPGDKVEQRITVKNSYRGCDYVRIYLRAEAHDETEHPNSPKVAEAGETFGSMTDFLSHLSMKVYQEEDLIYEASPEQLDGLAENVLLGSFDYGEAAELNVVLEVPIELGNEYANREGEVDWVFVAEHRNRSNGGGDDDDDGGDDGGGGHHDPTQPSSSYTPAPDSPIPVVEPLPPGVPKTGDDTVIWPYLLLLAAGLGGVIVPMLWKRKEKRK